MRSTRYPRNMAVTLVTVSFLALLLASCGGTGDPCIEAAQRLADCTGQQASPQFMQSCYQHMDQAAGLANASCEQINQAGQGKGDLSDWWDSWTDWLYGEDDSDELESSRSRYWRCFAPCQMKVGWKNWSEMSVGFVTMGIPAIDQEYARYEAEQACREHEGFGTLSDTRLNPEESVECRRMNTTWGCSLTCQATTSANNEGEASFDFGGREVSFEEEMTAPVTMSQISGFLMDKSEVFRAAVKQEANVSTLQAVVKHIGHGPLVKRCVEQASSEVDEYRVSPDNPGGCGVE